MPGLVAEVVEERVDAEVAVGAGELTAGRPGRGRVEGLPVRAQHALAAAGGAGGEEDVGDVVGRDGRGARVGGVEIGSARATNSSHVPSSVVDGHPDDVAQRGKRGAVEFGGPVGAEELAHADQQRRLGAGQDVGGLAGGVAGVERDDDGARVVRGQARDHPVPGVRRPDRDPVAGVHAEVDHRGGGLPDLGSELRRRSASGRR